MTEMNVDNISVFLPIAMFKALRVATIVCHIRYIATIYPVVKLLQRLANVMKPITCDDVTL